MAEPFNGSMCNVKTFIWSLRSSSKVNYQSWQLKIQNFRYKQSELFVLKRWNVLIKRSLYGLIKPEGVNIGSCSGLLTSRRQAIIYESMCRSDPREQTQILVNIMSCKCIENVCKTSATIGYRLLWIWRFNSGETKENISVLCHMHVGLLKCMN